MELLKTHCSWLHLTGPGSRRPRHTSSCCGYTPRWRTGTRGRRRSPPSSPGDSRCSSAATRLSRRRSRCLHRTSTQPARTLRCCTGRSDRRRTVWGRIPRPSRPGSRGRRRSRSFWKCTGPYGSGTPEACTAWPLRRDDGETTETTVLCRTVMTVSLPLRKPG